jgi:hypothetical protein
MTLVTPASQRQSKLPDVCSNIIDSLDVAARYEVNERRMLASPLDVNAYLSKRLKRNPFWQFKHITPPA